jgi:hypothetical protein
MVESAVSAGSSTPVQDAPRGGGVRWGWGWGEGGGRVRFLVEVCGCIDSSHRSTALLGAAPLGTTVSCFVM